jgi:hypothetical protein
VGGFLREREFEVDYAGGSRIFNRPAIPEVDNGTTNTPVRNRQPGVEFSSVVNCGVS